MHDITNSCSCLTCDFLKTKNTKKTCTNKNMIPHIIMNLTGCQATFHFSLRKIGFFCENIG